MHEILLAELIVCKQKPYFAQRTRAPDCSNLLKNTISFRRSTLCYDRRSFRCAHTKETAWTQASATRLFKTLDPSTGRIVPEQRSRTELNVIGPDGSQRHNLVEAGT